MRRLRCALVSAALLCAGSALTAEAAPKALPVAQPSVEAAPAGVHGRPFVGLLAVPPGFVQQEFLVSGTAHPYSGPAALAQRPLPGTQDLPSLPYTTRVVVVRPVDARRSNGAAVVTWHNVTFGHDIGEWFDVGHEVVDKGWTYVEASVQLASEPALKAFDPIRYATVQLPGDAYAYDIYSQVAKALRSGSLTSGRRPQTVLALGASQSGFAMDAYLADVQPAYERVFDGFVVAVANGPDHHTDRPVIRLLSEDEIDGSSVSPDARTYRQWEIAGSAHGNKDDFTYIGTQERRDLGVDLVNPLAGDNGPFGTSSCLINRFPADQSYDGALAALLRWVRTGTAPAVQPRVRVAAGSIVRDHDGNAVGGVRYPAMAVPRAAYNRTGDCVQLDGRTEPFSAARLKQLYPSDADYRRKLSAAVQASVRAGVLTPTDAARVR